MADQIVSWGGFNSKGTSGMGVTGSFQVSSSANSFFVGGGNVGINTTTPTANLQIYGLSNKLYFQSPTTNQGTHNISFGFGGAGEQVKFIASAAGSSGQGNLWIASAMGDTAVATTSDANVLFTTGGNTFYKAFIIDQSSLTSGNGLYLAGNQPNGITNGIYFRYSETRVAILVKPQGASGYADFRIAVVPTTGPSTNNPPQESDTKFMITKDTTNVLINTTTDPGGKLSIKGSGTTSSTTALLVQNANASASFQVKDDLTTTFGGSITVAKTGNNQLAILDTPAIEYRYNQGASGGQRINFGYYSTSFNFVPGYETLGVTAALGIRVTGSSTTTYAFSIINGNNVNPETEFRNAFDLDGNLYFRNNSTIQAISTAYASGGTLNVQGGQPRSDVGNGNGGTLSLNGGLGLGTGTPGDIILKTSTTGSSGNTPQSLTSRVWVKGHTGFVGIGTSSPSASLHVSGSVLINNILTLTPQDPLPTGVLTGSFAVSSSVPPKPYFYDGTSWNALY